MLGLRQNELFDPMKQDEKPNYDGIGCRFELLSVVHERNYPRVCLGHDEIIHVKKNRQFVHGQVMAN